MFALTELARDTNYNIDELLEKPTEWIELIYEFNDELKNKDGIRNSKFIGIANRLDQDNLVAMEKIFHKAEEDVDENGEPVFQDDVRLFESLGGTIEKIPKET